MFNPGASAEEVKQNEDAETNVQVVEEPITVVSLKQITAQKGQVVKGVHYQEQKVIDAQAEVKAAGQNWKKAKWRMRKTSSQQLDAQVQNAENDVKAQAYLDHRK